MLAASQRVNKVVIILKV